MVLSVFLSPALFAGQIWFPIERNYIKPLPIRFEYQLIDKDIIKIGNADIDTSLMKLSLAISEDPESAYNLKAQWPAGFLQSGSFQIRDSSGKAIWSEPADLNQVKIINKNGVKIGQFETSKNTTQLLLELRKIPFFKFCVVKEAEQARSYICSQDLYIKPKSKPLQIEVRDSFRKESFVEINGQAVEPQGVVVLNNRKDFLSMRAVLLSGANIEIESKQPNFEFIDFSKDEKNQKYLISTKGAPPLDGSLGKNLYLDVWQIEVDPDSPFVYLLGPADIPLKQEFVVQGPVKSSQVIIETHQPQSHSTFSQKTKIKLSPQIPLKKIEAVDAASTVEPSGENTFDWTIRNLEEGKTNRKWLKITHEDSSYYGSFDIISERSKIYQVRAFYPLGLSLSADWIFSKKFHMNASYSKVLQKPASEREVSFWTLGFFGREQNHFMKETGFSYALEFSSFTLDSKSSIGTSLAIAYDRSFEGKSFSADPKNPLLFSAKLNYLLAGLSGDLKSKPTYQLQFGLRQFLQQQRFWEAGFQHLNLKFSDSESVDFNYNSNGIYVSFGIFSK